MCHNQVPQLGEMYYPEHAESHDRSAKLGRKDPSANNTGENGGQKCANKHGGGHWIADVYHEFRQLLVEWQHSVNPPVRMGGSGLAVVCDPGTIVQCMGSHVFGLTELDPKVHKQSVSTRLQGFCVDQ